MTFISRFYNSRAQGVGYLEKMNNLPNHHGAGPMQQHRLKAGTVYLWVVYDKQALKTVASKMSKLTL